MALSQGAALRTAQKHDSPPTSQNLAQTYPAPPHSRSQAAGLKILTLGQEPRTWALELSATERTTGPAFRKGHGIRPPSARRPIPPWEGYRHGARSARYMIRRSLR